MTLQQLAYFLAAAAYGSFSAAADALHLAQPSLSEQIRRLEDELGVPLFMRGSRGLVLTDAGHALRPHAEAVAGEVEQARNAVLESRELRSGTAAFGLFGLPPPQVTADVVASFRARHPGMRVRLVGQNSAEVADAVREGRLEAGLVALPIDDRGLDVRPALREELLYVSADPKRVAQPVTIEKLAEAPLILYDARWGEDDPTRRQLRERAQQAGVKLEPEIEVEYVTAALELCARGLGDTVSSQVLLRSRPYSRKLAGVSFDPPLYDTFAFITRRNAQLTPATREFIALAEKRVSAMGRRMTTPDELHG
jgi:DNA-binding transcriptional LysR family regulator